MTYDNVYNLQKLIPSYRDKLINSFKNEKGLKLFQKRKKIKIEDEINIKLRLPNPKQSCQDDSGLLCLV